MHCKRTALFAVFAALAPVVAFATIPLDGVITACYAKSGGTLRVIDPTVTNCKSSETKLTWSVGGGGGAPVSGYEIMTNTADWPASTSTFASLSVSCSPGKNVLGGGATLGVDIDENGTFSATTTWQPQNSAPTGDGTGWAISYDTGLHSYAMRVTVYAVCADVAP